jgi:hypothetical protein
VLHRVHAQDFSHTTRVQGAPSTRSTVALEHYLGASQSLSHEYTRFSHVVFQSRFDPEIEGGNFFGENNGKGVIALAILFMPF